MEAFQFAGSLFSFGLLSYPCKYTTSSRDGAWKRSQSHCDLLGDCVSRSCIFECLFVCEAMVLTLGFCAVFYVFSYLFLMLRVTLSNSWDIIDDIMQFCFSSQPGNLEGFGKYGLIGPEVLDLQCSICMFLQVWSSLTGHSSSSFNVVMAVWLALQTWKLHQARVTGQLAFYPLFSAVTCKTLTTNDLFSVFLGASGYNWT